MKKLVLLVAILAMSLGVSGLAIAQSMEEATQTETPPETTPSSDAQAAQETTPSGDAQAAEETTQTETPPPETTPPPVVEEPLPCDVNLFRLEQEELVQTGYPTSVSERARECEELGYENPYPAPYAYDSSGFLYPYDPIEGIYYYIDPATGLYYVLDPESGSYSTYDPATGTYL